MSHSFVRPIVKKNLNLQTFRRREVQLLSDVEKKKRLRPCQRLKVRMTADKMAQTWFSNEKLFTVQTPTNIQNDSIYAAVSNTRLLKGRNTSLRVSCGLSKHGKTSLVFVDLGAKVNSSYYCDYVLGSNGLRDICRLSGNHFIFQQDGAPAHRSRQTVAFLTANVAGVHRARGTGHRTAQTSIRSTIAFGEHCNNLSIDRKFGISITWKKCWRAVGNRSTRNW